MTAKNLIKRYAMTDHPENGSFIERHYKSSDNERAASGSMYYYVAPGERTAFHAIDCDEYWCYVTGDSLEICSISEDGSISFNKFGIEPDCEPLIYFKKGTVFASKSPGENADGTFLTCITVPRFSYDGFKMYEDEEIKKMFPNLAGNPFLG